MEAPTACWSSIVKQTHPPPNQDHHELRSSSAAAAGRVFVDSCKSTKGIAVAVVDANAIIQGGERLHNCADKFVSVSQVIHEVRDPKSRHSLNFLPFSIDTMEPTPEALKKVISFAKATGDLQMLSDVDLKLIALTYTLEAQIHGTNHLRDSPPPIHTVNVKRLPEKDLPGWGSNVPNLEEWEALEQAVGDGSNPESRILPLKDLNLNIIASDKDQSVNGAEPHYENSHNQEDDNGSLTKSKNFVPKKKEVNIEGKKMVADGIDASQGQYNDKAGDWLPAVSRSTHRRFLRRKAKREMNEASMEKDCQPEENRCDEDPEDSRCPDLVMDEHLDEAHESKKTEGENGAEDISTILNQMRLEEDSKNFEVLAGSTAEDSRCPDLVMDEHLDEAHESKMTEGENGAEDISTILNQMRLEEDSKNGEVLAGSTAEVDATFNDSENVSHELDEIEVIDQQMENMEISSQTNESVDASYMDDSSEQSWMLRSLSESSVACITSDFAMQNVILQMGLRLLAPGGMQIRELHRWILKCHACYKVTTDIGRIFCPNCGNGGTLRKVAITVGENGIVLKARRPRISVRGTKFSLPLPQGGRDAITKNPILREDQLPQKYLNPKTKKKNKQGDEDIFASTDLFLHHTDKKAPLQPPVRKALAVFSGRRNPNDNYYSRARH